MRSETDPYAEQDNRDAVATSALTRLSTYTPKPSNESAARPKVSSRVTAIIGELALRYPPSSSDDAGAARGRLRLLQEDVSDVPVAILDRACRMLAKTSRFMPTAAEIVEAARKCLDDDKPHVEKDEATAINTTARNLKNYEKRSWLRWTKDGHLITLQHPTERCACAGDGRLIEPWFNGSHWEVMRADVDAVRSSYRAHGQKHHVADDGVITMVMIDVQSFASTA